MKFTVDRTTITEAVSNIQRAVSSKSSIPALEGILLQAEDGTLTMSANDLELGIKTVLPCTVAEAGKTVLSAKIFSEIVRKSPADHITVTVDEKNIAILESGHSNFSIIGLPAEEFPELPEVSDAAAFRLPATMLKSMIRQTIFAVAEGDAKPIHQGSLFHFENGLLDVVSVDGYRLAKRTEHIDTAETASFVVPGKTLQEINRLLKDSDEEITLLVGRRNIMLKIDAYTVTSSLLEGEFLNYNATIPAGAATTVLLKTREAIESVERVSLLITERLKSPLRCIFKDNVIYLNCVTSMGKASDQVLVSMEGETLEIGFNNKYLMDALKNTECDEIKIELNSALSPMKIMPKEGDSFLFLVLPVRLKNN